jgi:hypothetical protein
LSRPAWRASHDPAFITQQLIFNRWFKDYTEQPPITVLDNSEMSVEETSQQVAAWIDREIEFISL